MFVHQVKCFRGTDRYITTKNETDHWSLTGWWLAYELHRIISENRKAGGVHGCLQGHVYTVPWIIFIYFLFHWFFPFFLWLELVKNTLAVSHILIDSTKVVKYNDGRHNSTQISWLGLWQRVFYNTHETTNNYFKPLKLLQKKHYQTYKHLTTILRFAWVWWHSHKVSEEIGERRDGFCSDFLTD